MEGAGVEILMVFLLQSPSYYRLEHTYVEEEEDGSLALMELHPTYVDLLMAFYWWCHSFIEGNCVPPYSVWVQTTRVDFLHFLENVLWKTGEVPQFSFLVVGVLPGTLLKVLSRLAVPVQPPPLCLEAISPQAK